MPGIQSKFTALTAMKLSPLAAILLSISAASAEDSLKKQLDARKAEFEKDAPAEKIKSYDDGVAAVASSGILEKTTNVGDQAPTFTLDNATGKPVSLAERLTQGPVVLTWYRGGWCPYCNITLRALQQSLPEIEAAGGQLLALTPELPDKSLNTTEKNDLKFDVLTDLNNKVANKYGIVFEMTPAVEKAMRDAFGLKSFNGDDYDDKKLPLSATYVINKEGIVTYALLDADYRNRAEPAAIIKALQALK